MAVPLTASQIVTALIVEGVHVAEHTGWRTHNRDAATGKTFGPVNGVMIHHTAGTSSLELCYNGRSDLPGPLCHTHLSKAGTATMVGHGRANHAGTVAQNAYDAVVNESTVHPRPDDAEPVDGNDHFYGLEIENLGNGTDPYPAVQYDQAVRWASALCRAHGWSADSVIGHKEATRRKIDPSFPMAAFRIAVAARLAHPASWTLTEEDVPLTTDEIEKIARKVLTLDEITAPKDAPDVATNPTWRLDSYVKDIDARVRAVQTALSSPQPAVLTDAQVQALANSPVLAENIAELVAVKLAARLAS